MSLTRRRFLERLGHVGGYSAVYLGMQALGLLSAAPAAAAMPFTLPAESGRGRSIVILGAGIAGLVAAYELRRAGWDVTLLEARDRVGGRVWTVRPGDRVRQIGRPDQVCEFSDGLYLNAGAARIPTAHHNILGYARQLNVPLEVMVNANRSARWDVGGKIYTNRQMVTDLRGRISELLAKAIDKGALDRELTAADKDTLRRFLAFYGNLGQQGEYTANSSSGYAEAPGGYGAVGRPVAPMKLNEILGTRQLGLPLMFEEFFDQQAPMLQPVGGMDRIAHALYEQVKPAVRLNAPVLEIRRRGDGVRIVHGPGRQATDADYCLCALPGHLVARIPNDFSSAKQAALRNIAYGEAVKVGFEAPRFWESDHSIYGGVAWTDALNENLIYPSGNWHGPRGVLVAAYSLNWHAQGNAEKFAALSHEERFRLCREVVERLHPGRARELAKPLTVAWTLTPFSEGVGPNSPDWFQSPRPARYTELLKPEGPIFFAGEHLSYLLFWQEGAALSAHEAMRLLHQHAQQAGGASARRAA